MQSCRDRDREGEAGIGHNEEVLPTERVPKTTKFNVESDQVHTSSDEEASCVHPDITRKASKRRKLDTKLSYCHKGISATNFNRSPTFYRDKGMRLVHDTKLTSRSATGDKRATYDFEPAKLSDGIQAFSDEVASYAHPDNTCKASKRQKLDKSLKEGTTAVDCDSDKAFYPEDIKLIDDAEPTSQTATGGERAISDFNPQKVLSDNHLRRQCTPNPGIIDDIGFQSELGDFEHGDEDINHGEDSESGSISVEWCEETTLDKVMDCLTQFKYAIRKLETRQLLNKEKEGPSERSKSIRSTGAMMELIEQLEDFYERMGC